MNILFVCNQNKHRSKTAENIFEGIFNAHSAGLYNDDPVTEEELSWADVIAVMEDKQRREISERFPQIYMKKKIVNLEIPDTYYYGQPSLVKILKAKVEELYQSYPYYENKFSLYVFP